jgi:hypothetical protein
MRDQQEKNGRPYGTFPGLIPLGSPRYRYLGSHSPRAPRASRARGIPTGLYPGRPQGLPAPGLPRGSPGRSSVGIPREAVPGAPEGVPKGRVPLRGPRRFRSAPPPPNKQGPAAFTSVLCLLCSSPISPHSPSPLSLSEPPPKKKLKLTSSHQSPDPNLST